MAQAKPGKSSLFIIFMTVLIDLIGFGIVIPLVGIYGKHFGASAIQLPILGAVFSVLQFFFTPFWGSLSDRLGRRPIILLSLAGSVVSYLMFAYAPSFGWLLASRAFAGFFAANISAAQAYIADITTKEDRAKGMGMIGAAFGIGFTLGPPLGGIAAAKLGLAAPGLIAAAICGVNFVLAIFRLPESLTPELRKQAAGRSLAPLDFKKLADARKHPDLWFLFIVSFFVTFAFSNMEQTISLLFQAKFHLDTGEAGMKTGIVLMCSGLLGASIQGGAIRKLVPRFGERNLMMTGFAFNILAMLLFPFGPNYGSYFVIAMILSLGSSLINPTLAALVSKSAGASEQGGTLGAYQGLSSLARAMGPFYGLLTFAIHMAVPYLSAALISCGLLLVSWNIWKRRAVHQA